MALTTLSGEIEDAPRIATGIAELDRATGGGFVRGSALLVGGDPGIGKSTLLMQAAAALADKGHRVVYVSGEEAVAQIRLRAQRLGAADAPVELAAETNVEDILATHRRRQAAGPASSSIRSRRCGPTSPNSAPGTVTQVRASAQAVIRYAKSTGAAIVLVGHVTKEGQIAGPRVVEHMVDAVLYFEGEGGHHFRILRAVKNRFGPTDEIGVFEMSDSGLREVANPSELFLGERQRQGAGRRGVRRHGGHAAGAGRDPGAGRALAARHAAPRRRRLGPARGCDGARRARGALRRALCATHDVYLNVAGGYRITEPAADLAVAAALVSSLTGLALPADCVYFGEISLSGAVRPVAHAQQRLKEAEKLGFGQAVLPLRHARNCRAG